MKEVGVKSSNSAPSNPTRLISLKEVCNRIGRSRWWVTDSVRDGKFPKPIQIGYKSILYVEAEIEAWILEQIARRDAA